MKAKLDVELKPFNVPNFVVMDAKARPMEDGVKFDSGIALRDVSVETLEKLCEEFTEAVFKKAGKNRPPVDFQA
jgi:hypothetical protein